MPKERRGPPTPSAAFPRPLYGEHVELANLCSYLVSDQAAYITGECVE